MQRRLSRTEKGGHEEALDLDPLAAKLLDGEDGDIVSGDEAERGDDEVANADAEEPVPRRAGVTVKADLLQHDVLVQVDAVEPVQPITCEFGVYLGNRARQDVRNVKQEPARARAKEDLCMAPLGKVRKELLEMRLLRLGQLLRLCIRRSVRAGLGRGVRGRAVRVDRLHTLRDILLVHARVRVGLLLELLHRLLVLNPRVLACLCEARRLRERETLVERAKRGNERQADKDAPHYNDMWSCEQHGPRAHKKKRNITALPSANSDLGQVMSQACTHLHQFCSCDHECPWSTCSRGG